MVATVVELRMIDKGSLETAGRFVLLPSGSVEVVPISFRRESLEGLVTDPLPSPGGLVSKSDGRAYLDAIRALFHGDYVWATDPFEMDLDEALSPVSSRA